MEIEQPGASTFLELSDVPHTYAGSGTKAVSVNSVATGLEFTTGGSGSGTVTDFIFTNANGVSGSVLTSTTTPTLTLALGAITPSSVASTGAVTGTNLSGTNTGDQTTIVGITGTKAQFDTAVTDGNFLYVGDITQYTDEMAQDAVGAMVDTTLVYVDGTPLLTRAALTGAITAPQASNTTSLGSFTVAQLNTALSDGDVATGGGTATGTNTGDQNLFQTIAVSGQSDVVADTTTDTLTLVAGANITITTNAGTDSITIAASGGGPGGFAVTETELDFGTVGTPPVTDKTFTVTDASITSSSKIMCTESGNTATGRTSGDSLFDSVNYTALAGTGSFTVYARASGAIIGKRKMFYTYS